MAHHIDEQNDSSTINALKTAPNLGASPHGVLMQPMEKTHDAQKMRILRRAARMAMLQDNCHPHSLFIVAVFLHYLNFLVPCDRLRWLPSVLGAHKNININDIVCRRICSGTFTVCFVHGQTSGHAHPSLDYITLLTTQTASRSNQPFFHNSPTGQTNRRDRRQLSLFQHPLTLY